MEKYSSAFLLRSENISELRKKTIFLFPISRMWRPSDMGY